MNPLWDYFWPIFSAGVVIGAFIGHFTYRQARSRTVTFAGGAAAALIAAGLWHGPIGGANRLSSRIEASARGTLDHLEMTQVSARLERDPLRRRLVLSGAADDFQRAELVQILDDIPGVSGVRWATPSKPLAKPADGVK
ncbi:MAG: hypothetical protein ABI422_02335 [Sphingomicrobium sp.]